VNGTLIEDLGGEFSWAGVAQRSGGEGSDNSDNQDEYPSLQHRHDRGGLDIAQG
jgi:hypothetical protein